METNEGKKITINHPKCHIVSEAELTVMLPFPAGLLSFITSGRVSFLEETIWAKKHQQQQKTMNYISKTNIKEELP